MDTYLGFRVTNPYRSRSRKEYDPTRGHTGVDLGARLGSDLTFPIPFKVLTLREQPQMGKVLYGQDVEGNILVFAHLSEFLVKAGDSVKAGSVFARSGNTGSVTSGPHLHFEVLAAQPEAGGEVMRRTELVYKGYNIDPLAYLKKVTVPPHWSDKAMDWAQQRGLIQEKRSPTQAVTWGELVEVLYKWEGGR
ncbi:M23 family metallopeptidase [Candidatus Peregrinibacteria bacterium]|nr:MAG: M23 family metallopeptidase [Candidatus Peregrinibacteria bacterium]